MNILGGANPNGTQIYIEVLTKFDGEVSRRAAEATKVRELRDNLLKAKFKT